MIVIDATVLLPLLVRGPLSAAVARTSDREKVWVAVPPLWRWGLYDLLAVHIRAGTLPIHDAHTNVLAAAMLVRESHELFGERPVLDVMIESGLSASQAIHVLTARRLGSPLVTGDPAIVAACPDVAVHIESFGAS